MRLIDADALANAIVKVYGEDGLTEDASLIYGLLLNAPTIDAEPVVRCKECKHRYDYNCPMYYEEWFTIDEGDGFFDSDFHIIDETQDDGFCYMGQKERSEK